MPTPVRRRAEQRTLRPLPSSHTTADRHWLPAVLPVHLPRHRPLAAQLDRMPATLSRRCGLPEGAGEARQRIEESTGRGARRGAAAAHRGPVAAHARAARGYAVRFEPCLLVPAVPCAWVARVVSSRVSGRGRRFKAVRWHSCNRDPVRRSGRREAAGVSGARPEGGRDAAVAWGPGSGFCLSLGVLVHHPWLRPFVLQCATPPPPSAPRRTPHKLH